MKGQIVAYNAKNGMGAIRVEDDSISVVEFIAGCEIEKDDIVQGDLRQDGCFELYNVTQGQLMVVSIEATDCSTQAARHLLQI
ncbi:hypothetical protein [Vreelandella titanicae]|jgi:hypothetical protein|uniref:hypothetical protein n=1 Tax=Vreelandella titanicae TaxID=664683 RepID=UPI0015937269|nr:hypothetical protein [Halomonas titanicae]NVE91580.1 hypothetical protein [Halomonas titanicae]|tara:strand:- start:432 stop:680 length:249 start_codon:yes stop_codon:yes gene_type:complete